MDSFARLQLKHHTPPAESRKPGSLKINLQLLLSQIRYGSWLKQDIGQSYG